MCIRARHGAARSGRLRGRGWRDLGLEPADLLILRARREKDVPWAVEEGLRSGALTAVLAEVEGIPFAASRRLALAAAEGGTPALLLRHDELGPASAARTRWRVAALPGRADPFDEGAPGLPRWRLALVRARGGRPAACDVEWNRETGDFRLAAALADRPAAPRAATAQAGVVGIPRRSRAHAGG
jgi:protein ImuA